MLRRLTNFKTLSDGITITGFKVKLLGYTNTLNDLALFKEDYHGLWSLSVTNNRPYPKQPYLIVLTINNKLPYLGLNIFEYQKISANPNGTYKHGYTEIHEIFLEQEQVFEAFPRFYHTNESTMIKRLLEQCTWYIDKKDITV